jgi:3-oxoadipate enol-lactonase
MMPVDHSAGLPDGRSVDLPGRGTTFVRELPHPGRPVVLLLHGWTTNADLGWRSAFATLAERFHVIALDQRGHGQGIRTREPFRLEDCADDAAALVETLGLGPVIAVGYSMGGPVAQLLWQRHPHLVAGLVLCATSQTFNGTPRERALFGLLNGATLTARHLRAEQRSALAARLHRPASHDWLTVLDAGKAIARFDSRPWAPTIDVPTAVVVTVRDHVVPPTRQLELASAIPGASVHPVVGDHAVYLAHAEAFVPPLLAALDSVTTRAANTPGLAA